MPNPILNAPTPNQLKLDILREHFPQALETDDQGRIRINAAALQLAIDPSNPAGLQVEEDGFELRWVGKREAYHSAFVPVQKILEPALTQSKNWDTTGNLLIKGDNLDALRLLRHSLLCRGRLRRRRAESATSQRRTSRIRSISRKKKKRRTNDVVFVLFFMFLI